MKHRERKLTLDNEPDFSQTMPVPIYPFFYARTTVAIVGTGAAGSLNRHDVRVSIPAGLYSDKCLLVLDIG